MVSATHVIIVFMLTETVNSLPMFSLSAPSNGTFCPGRVTLTCHGIETPSLTWAINGSDFAVFSDYDPMQPLPLNLTLINPNHLTPGVRVQVNSVNPDENNLSYNVSSTLIGDASLLRGSIIECRRIPFRSNTISITDIRDPPPSPSSATCSLVNTTGGPEVSIQWSPSFTSQYNVEMYHVVVNPATTSCPSEMIRPSESFRCGLVLGTLYSFSVSAINCGNQEGGRDSIMIQLRAPDVTVLPVYNQNGRLNQLTVQWMQQTQSFSDKCSFNHLLSYTVVLGDSTRERVDQRMVNSNNCSNNLCSISFPLSLSDQTDQSYFVTVNVTGAFGSTSTSTYLNTSIPSSFNVSFSSEGCVTSVICSYPMREGDCLFQYVRDSSYQDLSPSLSTSLNSPLQITVLDAATIHYYQVTINTSSLNLQVRGNFTSGEGARLTSSNQGLLVVGVILLSMAIVLGVIITLNVFKKGPWLSLGLSVTGFVLTFASLVLWVVVGFHVGLQKSTCDPTWQSSRDGLIISAHVFSDYSLLIFAAAGIYFAVDYISLPNYKKRSSEQMSFWQKCLHRSLSNSIQAQQREEGWKHNLKDKKIEELEVGEGGRIKELEDLNANEFRKPGQPYMEAKLETQERYYKEYKDELPTDGSKGEEPAGGPNKEKDQHYLPLDHKMGGKGVGNKDKPSGTQGRSGEEYSVLGNSKEKPAPSQAPKVESEHYLPLDHGKGDRSGHKDKPSRGEYSALSNNKDERGSNGTG